MVLHFQVLHFQVFHLFWSPIFRCCIFSPPTDGPHWHIHTPHRWTDRLRLQCSTCCLVLICSICSTCEVTTLWHYTNMFIVITEWWGAGIVICLKRYLSLASVKSRFISFLIPAHLGSPRQRDVKWVYVCVMVIIDELSHHSPCILSACCVLLVHCWQSVSQSIIVQ